MIETRHHLTPKCIAKVWGISKKEIESSDNIEMLPDLVHRQQDLVVPMLLDRAIRQKNGIPVTLWTHYNENICHERRLNGKQKLSGSTV